MASVFEMVLSLAVVLITFHTSVAFRRQSEQDALTEFSSHATNVTGNDKKYWGYCEMDDCTFGGYRCPNTFDQVLFDQGRHRYNKFFQMLYGGTLNAEPRRPLIRHFNRQICPWRNPLLPFWVSWAGSSVCMRVYWQENFICGCFDGTDEFYLNTRAIVNTGTTAEQFGSCDYFLDSSRFVGWYFVDNADLVVDNHGQSDVIEVTPKVVDNHGQSDVIEVTPKVVRDGGVKSATKPTCELNGDQLCVVSWNVGSENSMGIGWGGLQGPALKEALQHLIKGECGNASVIALSLQEGADDAITQYLQEIAAELPARPQLHAEAYANVAPFGAKSFVGDVKGLVEHSNFLVKSGVLDKVSQWLGQSHERMVVLTTSQLLTFKFVERDGHRVITGEPTNAIELGVSGLDVRPVSVIGSCFRMEGIEKKGGTDKFVSFQMCGNGIQAKRDEWIEAIRREHCNAALKRRPSDFRGTDIAWLRRFWTEAGGGTDLRDSRMMSNNEMALVWISEELGFTGQESVRMEDRPAGGELSSNLLKLPFAEGVSLSILTAAQPSSVKVYSVDFACATKDGKCAEGWKQWAKAQLRGLTPTTAHKGAAIARVVVGGRVLCFAGVHLEAKDQGKRWRQGRLVRDSLGVLGCDAEILMGDFNTRPANADGSPKTCPWPLVELLVAHDHESEVLELLVGKDDFKNITSQAYDEMPINFKPTFHKRYSRKGGTDECEEFKTKGVRNIWNHEWFQANIEEEYGARVVNQKDFVASLQEDAHPLQPDTSLEDLQLLNAHIINEDCHTGEEASCSPAQSSLCWKGRVTAKTCQEGECYNTHDPSHCPGYTDRVIWRHPSSSGREGRDILRPCTYHAPTHPSFSGADHGPVVARFGIDVK